MMWGWKVIYETDLHFRLPFLQQPFLLFVHQCQMKWKISWLLWRICSASHLAAFRLEIALLFASLQTIYAFAFFLFRRRGGKKNETSTTEYLWEKDDIARSPLNLVWFAYIHGGLLRSCGIERKTTSKDKQRPQNRIGNFVPAFRTIFKVRDVATEQCDLFWIFKSSLEGFLQTKNTDSKHVCFICKC